MGILTSLSYPVLFTVLSLFASVTVSAQDHEYNHEDWLISATDFSSLDNLEMIVDDCDPDTPAACTGTSDQPKPHTTLEATGRYVSHCGDRAKVLAAARPCYPKFAKAARATGVVSVMVVVNEQGAVVWARAVRGHPLLRRAAVRAACRWQFEQTKFCPRVNRMIAFNFQLE